MKNWKDDWGDRAFFRKIAAIALPVSAQQLITVGVNLMDTVMLSSMGDAQLSASALGGQFINLFQIFCMGIGMGASVLTARYWGMKELPSLRKAVTIMLRFVLSLSTAFTLAAGCMPEMVMRIYTPEAEIIAYGATYLRWLI
ncbi:MAG: MATE family efflux transporter, partial [Clostridia bacterium]|nr:MATE family efflux transporter [Clostridia bacterium]